MTAPYYPSLYQANTRVWLTAISRALGRHATLDDIPDADLDRLAAAGMDWIWLLSAWRTGPIGRRVSRGNAEWRREFANTLPDLSDDDIAGSGFAIQGYEIADGLGGALALERLRRRLERCGLKLMLDFVPNHTAIDHPWVEDHPEYYVAGSEHDLTRAPQNYTRVRRKRGDRVLAYGRDPYFAAWPDTLQLDYGNPRLQDAMIDELTRIAGLCDGVRCDMAMLVLPEVFERTWGRRAEPFWARAVVEVRKGSPRFVFMAEVYWDLEWTLQQQGFDYTYDKRLYDRLRDGHACPVREHLRAGLDFQDRLVRFLENHDEPRAASAFPPGVHEAAAVVTFLAPGLRLFHQGQFEGRRKRIFPHLVRGPEEPVDRGLGRFYDRLLTVLRADVLRRGRWELLECAPAWEGNGSHNALIAMIWCGADDRRCLVTVNYAPHRSQCYCRLPLPAPVDGSWRLTDLLGEDRYYRNGSELSSKGLYLDLAPWQYHVFEVTGP